MLKKLHKSNKKLDVSSVFFIPVVESVLDFDSNSDSKYSFFYWCFEWCRGASNNKKRNPFTFESYFRFFFSLIFNFSPVTPNQIERLYSRFTSLDRTDCGTLSREDFLRIPELAINPLCDRIVHAFFADSADDRVNFRQFMKVLAHFRPIRNKSTNKYNSREEKLKCN